MAALFAKGFRPFFLLAALHASLTVPLWFLTLGGYLGLPAHFVAPYWHAHEMVFGFALAVIAGFLLTAVSNWTGRETVTGAPLALLALLWLSGRALIFVPFDLSPWLVAVVDLAFIPALGVVLGRPLIATMSRRNYGFLGLLTALFGANLAMHATLFGAPAPYLARGARFGVDVVVLMIVVMTGRILPMFTQNATRALGIRSHPALDRAAVLLLAALALGDGAGGGDSWLRPLAVVAGVLVVARAWHWGARHTLAHPLLWVLHAATGFIALGLLLRGAGAEASAATLHALTVGSIGLATLGMMARVALGHTGRMLAAPRLMTPAFLLVSLAASLRVLSPLFGQSVYLALTTLSGVAFALAFALYLVAYGPMLVKPRIDGKSG